MSIVNNADLTLRQMFDVSTRLVSEQFDMSGLETTGWEKHLWKHLSLISDETIINLQRTKVYVFSDSVLCLGRSINIRNPAKRVKTEKSYRDYDGINGEPTEFEWNIFPGFNTLQFSQEVKSFIVQIGRTTKKIHRKNLCRCSTTFLAEQKTMKKNVWQMPDSYLCMREDLEKDNGHSLVLVLRKSGTLSKKTVHKEFGIISRRKDVVGIR